MGLYRTKTVDTPERMNELKKNELKKTHNKKNASQRESAIMV
jgi:hypothetical protein